MIENVLTSQSEALECDGYLVPPGFFSNEQIDEVEAAARRACSEWAMEIVIDDLVTGERTFYGLVADQKRGWFKLNDLYLVVEQVRALALDARLSELLRALPGSHKFPLYRFRDGSHHAAVDELPQCTEYIFKEVKARELQKETFFARRGDVFIWHADLLHGGANISDPQKTRRSLVCHYFVESDVRVFRDWNLVPMNAGFWIDRPPQSVRAAPERFDEAHPFPEKIYLRRHPDVGAAVAEGRIPSGFAHYRQHGFAEGRGI